MEKFICILLICITIYAEENDAGPSQKEKGKRKLDEYLKENSCNTNESNQIMNDQLDLDNIIVTDEDYRWLHNFLATDENIQRASSAQQNSQPNDYIAMNNQLMEQNPAVDTFLDSNINDENVPHSSTNQQQILDQNLILEDSAIEEEDDKPKRHSTTNIGPELPLNKGKDIGEENQTYNSKGQKIQKESIKKKDKSKTHQFHSQIQNGSNEFKGKQSGFRFHILNSGEIAPPFDSNILNKPTAAAGEQSGVQILSSNKKHQGKVKKPAIRIETTSKMKKIYKCTWPNCTKEYTSYQKCWKHQKIHQPDFIPYKCTWQECKKEFKYKSNLREHMKAHQYGPFICDKCGKNFKQKIYLDAHAHLKNKICDKEENNEQVVCDKCGKNFKRKIYLDAHLKNKICDKEEKKHAGK